MYKIYRKYKIIYRYIEEARSPATFFCIYRVTMTKTLF